MSLPKRLLERAQRLLALANAAKGTAEGARAQERLKAICARQSMSLEDLLAQLRVAREVDTDGVEWKACLLAVLADFFQVDVKFGNHGEGRMSGPDREIDRLLGAWYFGAIRIEDTWPGKMRFEGIRRLQAQLGWTDAQVAAFARGEMPLEDWGMSVVHALRALLQDGVLREQVYGPPEREPGIPPFCRPTAEDAVLVHVVSRRAPIDLPPAVEADEGIPSEVSLKMEARPLPPDGIPREAGEVALDIARYLLLAGVHWQGRRAITGRVAEESL